MQEVNISKDKMASNGHLYIKVKGKGKVHLKNRPRKPREGVEV